MGGWKRESESEDLLFCLPAALSHSLAQFMARKKMSRAPPWPFPRPEVTLKHLVK